MVYLAVAVVLIGAVVVVDVAPPLGSLTIHSSEQ